MAKGAPLVGIEGMNSTDWELDSTDPAISSCAALKGRMIGVDSIGGARYDALVVMLSKCNLTINDVKTVDLPGSTGMDALVAGQLTLNVDHLDETRQVQALTGKPLTVVLKLSDVDPYQHFELLVTTKDKLAANRALFVKVLEGDIAAANWLADPKNLGAGATIAQITGDSASVARDALATYVRAKWWNASESGLTVQRITRTIGLGLRLGIIPPAGNEPLLEDGRRHVVWQPHQRRAAERRSRRSSPTRSVTRSKSKRSSRSCATRREHAEHVAEARERDRARRARTPRRAAPSHARIPRARSRCRRRAGLHRRCGGGCCPGR